MKKAIIFDFDGVLIDSFEIAYGVARQVHAGISRDDYRDFFMGNVYEDEQVNELSIKKFFALQRHIYNKLKLGSEVIQGVKNLSQRYKMFIVSSNEESEMRAVLENSGIEKFFTDYLGCETGRSKVKKFKILIDKYCLASEDCVFVTDTLGDILEANRSGIDVIAVDYGFHGRDRLNRAKTIAVVSDFAELVDTINVL